MPIANTQGAVVPRWRHDGKAMHADRIQHHANGLLYLESGAQVHATEELLASGPARMGDFWVCETDADGKPTGAERLVAGSVFQNDATPIAHALDIPQVSADEQQGYAVDQPTSGDPADPAAKPASESQSVNDPMVAKYEADAAKSHEDAAKSAEA